MKWITTVQYQHTFHPVIPRNLLSELRYDKFEDLPSQNHVSLDPLV
jgi:hypothetical protein